MQNIFNLSERLKKSYMYSFRNHFFGTYCMSTSVLEVGIKILISYRAEVLISSWHDFN